jgi:site-specific DNA-methyltransferase (adenine-specific)
MALQIEYIAVADLLPYARNARTHSDEQVAQIAASIKEFGFVNPCLIGDDGVLIAGHGRLSAARKLGMDKVPCIRLEGLSDAQRRALVLADNRIALNAGWDDEMLAVELSDLKLDGFDLDLLGFDDTELADLLAEKEEPAAGLTDDDATPEPPANPVTVAGDVWLMGKHRLMCGDSTSIEALETLCQGQHVDMWLTDPPYNVAYEGKTKDALKIKNDAMGDGDFRQFLRDAYVAADAVMKAGAVFYIWHADSEGYNFRGAAKDAGWTVRQCLVWKKQA